MTHALSALAALALAGQPEAFYTSRGISFHATFDRSLTADHSDGRARPLNPLWAPLYPQQKIAFHKGKVGNADSCLFDAAHLVAFAREWMETHFK